MSAQDLPSAWDPDETEIRVAGEIQREFADELHSPPEEEWSLCRLIARRAIEAHDAGRWLPMQTAPKGTRYILAWSPERHMTFQVNWTESVSSLGHERRGWTIIGESSPSPIQFSHWQSMPNEPEDDDLSGDGA